LIIDNEIIDNECRKDRGDDVIDERDILVTSPDSYREALIGLKWQSLSRGTKDSVVNLFVDGAFIKA
jgi:hypothetical protein